MVCSGGGLRAAAGLPGAAAGRGLAPKLVPVRLRSRLPPYRERWEGTGDEQSQLMRNLFWGSTANTPSSRAAFLT